jgi:transcriptional regulator with XRE-family HTH domain
MQRDVGPLLRAWLVPRIRPADLARAAGCSHQYVSAVLAGRKPPSARLLEAARTLGLPVDVIAGDEK